MLFLKSFRPPINSNLSIQQYTRHIIQQKTTQIHLFIFFINFQMNYIVTIHMLINYFKSVRVANILIISEMPNVIGEVNILDTIAEVIEYI